MKTHGPILFHERMIWSEEAGRHRFEYTWRLSHGKLKGGCHVLVRPVNNDSGILEILPAAEANRLAAAKTPLTVVGMAESREEAIETARRIVEQIYLETGEVLDTGRYFGDGSL